MKSWAMVVCAVASVLLVGCGGQEEAPTPEEEGRADTPAGETTSATEKTSSAFDRTTPGGRTALPGERVGHPRGLRRLRLAGVGTELSRRPELPARRAGGPGHRRQRDRLRRAGQRDGHPHGGC